MPELIPGVQLDFGGSRIYTVPPLSLGALERLQGKLAALSASAPTDPATIHAVVDATHSALVRNYPGITRDQVAELVDLGNMHEVIACVMDVAGLKRKAVADAIKNQQAQPAASLPPTGPL